MIWPSLMAKKENIPRTKLPRMKIHRVKIPWYTELLGTNFPRK